MADAVTKTLTIYTNPPTGLTLARNGNKITAKWKIGAKNYGAGQQLQWRVFGATKWNNVTVGRTTTAKSFTFPASSYYPYTKKTAGGILVRVRGKKLPDDRYDPDWSEWEYASIDFQVPNTPSISAVLSDTYTDRSTFTWNTNISTTNNKPFVNVERQTVVIKNCNSPLSDGKKYFADTAVGVAEAANDSETIQEDTAKLAQASYTRWVRVRSRGAAGHSEWAYARHVYARPNQAVITSASANETKAGGYVCSVYWKVAATHANPIDETNVEYAIATPLADLVCPSGTQFTPVDTVKDTTGGNGSSFSIDDVLGPDECLFIRVNTVHDRNTTFGAPTRAAVGYLEDPPVPTVVTEDSTHRAAITAVPNSQIPGEFFAVWYRAASAPNNSFICGIITADDTQPVTVQGPNWDSENGKFAFGIQGVIGSYTAKPRADGTTGYSINKKMATRYIEWRGGIVPPAPDAVDVVPTDQPGSVRVSWDWTWEEATAAEISWSDNPDAWESTDEPSRYTVTNLYSASWVVSGVAIGQPWYFRVRLIAGETIGPYCEPIRVNLFSAPAVPVLQLSDGVITEDGSVTARWGYVSTDGTPQARAYLRLYSREYVPTEDNTIDPGKTYYVLNPGEPVDPDDPSGPVTGPFFEAVENPIAADLGSYYELIVTRGPQIESIGTAQSAVINAHDSGWVAGREYGVAVKVWSASGSESEWSDIVYVSVALPITAVIVSTSLQNVPISDDDDQGTTETVLALTEMPLTVTVTGAGNGGTTILAIERAAGYVMERPDETITNGPEGETVALIAQTGETPITITRDDLIGTLDDGAYYRIVATVQDGLGQSSTAELEFPVAWSDQAIIPAATAVMDQSLSVAFITPVAPSGAAVDATADIYRLSADKPELIYQGAAFGETIVDPYPAIGRFGGHRIVYRTADGDYITDDNTFAWIDLGKADGDYLDLNAALIDFNGIQIPLIFNSSISSNWTKDFIETRYMGGSIQGDWNAGVSRSGSFAAVARVEYDDNAIQMIRRLATWPGICHIRTLDGSSFSADIQVSDSWDFGSPGRTVDINLEITRVDPESLDGVPYDLWAEE